MLSEATNRFDLKCLVGTGGSCRVFRAVVFGRTVAIKMFNETEGKWDDMQIQSEVEL